MAIAPDEGFDREPEGSWGLPDDAPSAFGDAAHIWGNQSDVPSALAGEDTLLGRESELVPGWAAASDEVPNAFQLPSAWSTTQVPSGLADPVQDDPSPSAEPLDAMEPSHQPESAWDEGWSQGDAPRALDADQPAGSWLHDDVPSALGLPPILATGLARDGAADLLARLANGGADPTEPLNAPPRLDDTGKDVANPTVPSWEEVDVTPAFNDSSSSFTGGTVPSAAADAAAAPSEPSPEAWGVADVPNALVFGDAPLRNPWADEEGVPSALTGSIHVPLTPQSFGRGADPDAVAAEGAAWDAEDAPPAMTNGPDWGTAGVPSGLTFPKATPDRSESQAASVGERKDTAPRADEMQDARQAWEAGDAPSALAANPAGWGASDSVPSGLAVPGADRPPISSSPSTTGPSVTPSVGTAPFTTPSSSELPASAPHRASSRRSAKGARVPSKSTDADARGDPADQKRKDTRISPTGGPTVQAQQPGRSTPAATFPDPGSPDVWDGEGGGNPDVWESVRTADYMVALMARIDIEVETQMRADTGMDEPNRERLERAKGQASDVVPRLGWSQSLLSVMKLAAVGRLTTGDDGLFRQPSEGSGAGRRVSTQRVQLLLEAGFLAVPPEGSAVRLIRPTAQGEQALFLAALHPEGIYSDDGAAFEARLKAVRRPWHSKEDSKSAARRLASLDRWAMVWSDDRPQRLSDEEHESAVRALVMFAYDDLERVVARLWKASILPRALADVRDALAAAAQAASEGDRSAATQAFNTAHAHAGLFGKSLNEDPRGEEATEWIRRLQQRIDEYMGVWATIAAVARAQAQANAMSGPSPQSRATKPAVPAVPGSVTPAPTFETTQLTASAEREVPTGDEQSEVSDPESQPSHAAVDGEARRAPASASPSTTAPRSAAPSGPDTAHLLQMQWTLPLGPTPPPLGDEEQATAVAVRASLSADGLIDLLAAAYDTAVYSEWKRRYLSRGEGNTQVGSTPVRYQSYSDRLEATVGDIQVAVTWDRVRAWVREIATPEVVSFLDKVKTAASRFPHHRQGEERWQAMGELALARTLRERVEVVKREVLDHAIGYLSSRSIPANARGGRPASAHAGGQGLFDMEGPFALPPMNELNEDLDRIITLLPPPSQNAPKRLAALSELTPGTVIELDDSPIVISEINAHPGRVDIIGEHRGPMRPHRIKHSLDLTTDAEPSLQLADLPPSLAPLVGPVPRREMGVGPGPLVDGHPDVSAQIQSAAGGTVPQPPAGPPQPRLEAFVWNTERRRAHGQGIGQANGTRPPVSKARREMDPDDPFVQFVDNLQHQLVQLTERPAERAAVEQAAAEIREAVTDLAARAMAYSTERMRQAEQNPTRLLQITMEPSLSVPFSRLAMNSVMSAIDRAEAAVPQKGQKARVRAALEAVVCSNPPRDPQGDALADFGDALAPFSAMDGRTSDTVAELLATPEQWTHFNLMAAEVHQLTSQTTTAEPAARFSTLEDVRLHLTALASEEISADSGPQREHALNRARRAARLANDPSLELAPSGRLLVHGSVRDGWHVVAPGSAKDVVPWSVRTRKHALAFADLLVRLTDETGAAYPWDADDFLSISGSRVPGAEKLHEWVTSSPSHTSYSFRDRLRRLRWQSASAGWMEDLALYRFSDYGFIHPAGPGSLNPGDEIMFAFDQDELTYAPSVAAYYPPPYFRNRAIGTATVDAAGNLIPGYWWPERRPEEAQKLALPVHLHEGVRRARQGEYQLHEGISAHLPAPAPQASPVPEPVRDPVAQHWAQEAPAALREGTPDPVWTLGDNVPSALDVVTSSADSAGTSPRDLGGRDGASAPDNRVEDPGAEPDTGRYAGPEPIDQEEATPQGSAPESDRQREGVQVPFPRLKKAERTALADVTRGDMTRFGGMFMLQTHPVRRAAAASQDAVARLIELRLAEVEGQRVRPTSQGLAWFGHHGVEMPGRPETARADGGSNLLATAGVSSRSSLLVTSDSIDYSPTAPAQVVIDAEWPQPPAPSSFPDNWHNTSPDEEAVSAALAKAERAKARFAQSTARDIAALAIPVTDDRWLWTRHRPLAQFDENAAAALERLTDPATVAYTIQAVQHLREALEEVGRGATEDYLQRILAAGSDPVLMDKAWRTDLGVSSDPTYVLHVRAVVINYLVEVAAHAEAAGLDGVAVAEVLEDAAGWDGRLQQFGKTASEYPHFPDAEAVVESAQFVADAARHLATGSAEKVRTWIELRRAASDVEPRPARTQSTVTGHEEADAGPMSTASLLPLRSAKHEQKAVSAGGATNQAEAATPLVPQSVGTAAPYAYPREATDAWQLVVDTMAALDASHRTWPRTTRNHVALTDAKAAVARIATRIPAVPSSLPEVAHQLRELDRMLGVIQDDLDRSRDDELKARLAPQLSALVDAHAQAYDRTQAAARQLTRNEAGTWLHPWVTELPEGTRTSAKVRAAGTSARPRRVLHADGTLLQHIGSGMESVARAAVAVGVIDAPHGTGAWQVVRFEDGTHEVAHPALLHPVDQEPYPPPADLDMPVEAWASRWQAFDRAEAAGAATASVGVGLIMPGDRIQVPDRKGERTVTSIERGVRRRSGRKHLTGTAVHHRGAGKARTAEYLVTNPAAELPVTLPTEHPALDNYPGKVALTKNPIPPGDYHQFSYRWSATVMGGHEGKYSVTGDCQGKVRNGIPDHKTYRVHYVHGEGKELKVWALGLATTLEGAAEYISSHWQRSQTGDHRAEAQQDYYASGLWLLPDVGEGEYLVYRPDGSWELTSREGRVYDIRDDRSERVGNLEVRHNGDLVGVTTEHYGRRWPQMLSIVRGHSENADSAAADAEHMVREGLGHRLDAAPQTDAAPSTAPVEGPAMQGDPVAEAVNLSDRARTDHELSVEAAGQDASAEMRRGTEALFELPETETPEVGGGPVAPGMDALGVLTNQQGSPARAPRTAVQPEVPEPSDRERSPQQPGSSDDLKGGRSEAAGPEGERRRSGTADPQPVAGRADRPTDAPAKREEGSQDRQDAELASQHAVADGSLAGPFDIADTGQATAGHDDASAQTGAEVEGPLTALTAGRPPSPDRAPAPEGEGSTTVSDVSTASGSDQPAEQLVQMTPPPADQAGEVGRTVGPAVKSPAEERLERQEGESRGSGAPARPGLGELQAYVDPSAYKAAHQDVLAALDQHEDWLHEDAAAAAAASELRGITGVNLPALAALLALGSAAAAAESQGAALAAFTDRLRRHVRRTQLMMAGIVVEQAARTTDRDLLRNMHTVAAAGRFVGFQWTTDAGEMEIGQYIEYRADQLNQLAKGPTDTVELGADTAEADSPVDEYDEPALPALEFPDGGGAYFSYTEGAPSLHARATALLQGQVGTSGELVFVDGRPIYAMVIEQAGPGDAAVRSLFLGLSMGQDARTVHITTEELAAADPQRLMAAMNGWIAADDNGDRPLLTYQPTVHAAAATPDPVGSTTSQIQSAQASTTPETAPAAPQEQPQPAPAPARKQTPAADSAPAPAESAAPMSSEEPGPGPSAQPAVSAGSPADPVAAGSDGRAPGVEVLPVREEARGPETAASPAPAEQREGPDIADRLAVLARKALGSLASRREVTVTMTAPDYAVITVEATGHHGRNAYLTGGLSQALNREIRSQNDRSLNRLRIDVQHGATGQTLLPTNGPAVTVLRSRLIDANVAAAQIFATRLRADPSAELARTYLHEGDPAIGIRGRQIPPEVQEQWGIGYAPSQRDSGSWDVLAQELMNAGFSEEELVQSGLAKYSQNGRLYDAFSDRIMFPIHNQVGEIVGFGGRRVDRPGESSDEAKDRGGPKYLNTEDTAIFRKGELVFGLYHPAQAETREASNGPRVGLEGYFDVIAMARAAESLPLEQRPVAGAPMGTALTKDQLMALRGIREGKPRTHVLFGDNDPAGRRALLKSWDMLLTTPGTTEVTSASDVKDAADLWEAGVAAGTGGAEPVLRVLDQRQPLLEAAVEAQLMVFATDNEQASHVFDGGAFDARSRAAATQAAQLITADIQDRAPQDARERQAAALTWAKRLHQSWQLPGHLIATAVLLGPGDHDVDHQNAVYQEALDVLAADPDGYFADDQHVRSRQSAIFADEADEPATTPSAPATSGSTGAGHWPAGTKPGVPTATAAEGGPLPFAMSLHSPRSGAGPAELTDRNAGAYSLYVAVYDRLGQHAIEEESPGHLAQPLALGSLHGVDLATSGADQQAEDPSIVVWLGTESLRLSYKRFTAMTPLEFLAAVEWRAATAAGKIGTPLSQAWRKAVRTILAPSMPHNPGPEDFAVLLDTVAATAGGHTDETRRRAQQAVDLYTAGHPDLALDHLAAADHIWVLQNEGGWVQESADVEPTWEEVSENLAQEAEVLNQLGQEAASYPSPELTAHEPPVAADLTIAHHSAHEAIAALRPYSIGLPGTVYERMTDLVAQMDASVPAARRLRGPSGERLMGRVRTSLVRALEGLATAAGKIRLRGVADRLERAVSRLRGQASQAPLSRAVRVDRRLQDLNHTERDLERRMAASGTTMAEIGDLQEQWIINRARWRARYEQITGQPATADFLPHTGLIAGAPAIPNPVAAHGMLIARLRTRVAEERDVDPHTGEMSDPWNATADLFNGVAWAYQQRMIGSIPSGPDPEGPLPPEHLRQAALIVTARRDASPLTLRRALDISAERADRLLHQLEAQQILGPYRPDTTRTVLAQSGEIDALLARPARPRPPAPTPPDAASQEAAQAEFNGRRTEIEEVVTRFLAEQTARNDGQPNVAPNRVAAAGSRGRAAPREEAQSNALAAHQTTHLTHSQS
ncbi:toprim domain-containing protein [Streptomyces sp. NPDC007872]|uniref:toprim domain-containing protein n=1 Tax=Streptomyces sp. NPDC007872 TaxID=3364782 RepID=UPI0036C96F41